MFGQLTIPFGSTHGEILERIIKRSTFFNVSYPGSTLVNLAIDIETGVRVDRDRFTLVDPAGWYELDIIVSHF